MQSGKFFSEETLKKLEVLNEDLETESQIDEAPLGALAGLGQRALATFGIGQSTRAFARGKLDLGKKANELYNDYYNNWLPALTPPTPSRENILAFLNSRSVPTANASKILDQAETDNAAKDTSKARLEAEKENKARNKAAAKKSSFVGGGKGPPYTPRSKVSTVTTPTSKSAVPESLNDILRLSGLPEIVNEELTNKQISDAFTAATGEEYINAQQAKLAPGGSVAGGGPSGVPGGGAGGGPSGVSGGGPRVVSGGGPSGVSGGGAGGGPSGVSGGGSNPLAEFTVWVDTNKANIELLKQARKLLNQEITKLEAAAAAQRTPESRNFSKFSGKDT